MKHKRTKEIIQKEIEELKYELGDLNGLRESQTLGKGSFNTVSITSEDDYLILDDVEGFEIRLSVKEMENLLEYVGKTIEGLK